jgi:hypothetical protein
MMLNGVLTVSLDGHSNKQKKSSSDKHWKDGPSTKCTKPATQLAKLQKEKQLGYALVLVKVTSQVDGGTCVVFGMSSSISIPIIFQYSFSESRICMLRAHPSHPSHAVINSYEI